jgi:WXG100 family type VII secretion target
MGQFSVSTPALGYSAAAMSNAVAEFDGQVSQINGIVSSIVGASWTGEAATAFAESWAEWQASAGLTRDALSDIVARLGGAETTYVATEMQVTAASRSSTVGVRRQGGGVA